VSSEPTFEQIVKDHQAMVFRTLARLTGRTESLDDLAQDVFLRLYRALPGFRGEALISTYVYRIAVNVAQNEWRRRQREDLRHISLSAPLSADDPGYTWESRLEHPGSDALEQLQESEFAALVQQHLNQLSQVEQSVLVLYHQEERSYEQIAQILGMPIGTVRTHLHRGRNKMRQSLLLRKGAAHGR
jgi:RNA polymerase sigma factor (sigma-70 family)